MIIMGCAMTFMVGMSANALFFYKGYYIDPRKRQAMIVTWGDSDNTTLVSRMLDFFGVQKYGLEGLGVDHEEWKKEKEEYKKVD